MTGTSIVAHFAHWRSVLLHKPVVRTHDLHDCWQHPSALPRSVAASPPALRLLELLGPLDWTHLPERNLVRNWGHATVPHAAFIAAGLVKINEGKVSMGNCWAIWPTTRK